MKRIHAGRVLPFVLLASTAAALAVGADASGSAAREALSLCARILIPSLFPYMVVSSMAVSLGAADVMGRPLRSLFRRVLRLPDAAAGSFLLGMLCGFPIGAKTACTLYARGTISKDEAERLAALSNNVSPAYLIGVVGAIYWHSAALGALLYAVQILIALGIGVLYARSAPILREDMANKEHPPVPSGADWTIAFTAAVGEAASSVVTVCGFAVIFACLFSMLSSAAAYLGLEGALLWAAPFFEITVGVGAAAAQGGSLGLFLTGFAAGWGGLSVCAQSEAFAAPHRISLRRMIVAKLVQGIVTGTAACFLGSRLTSAAVFAVVDSVHAIPPTPLIAAELVLLALFCLFPVIFRKRA